MSEKNKILLDAERKLQLGPVAMSRAMGVSYDTYKNWRSGRNRLPAVGARCVVYMLAHPDSALALSTEI